MDGDALRLFIFGAVLALMAAAEHVWPRRQRTLPRGPRWRTNVGMAVLGALAVRVMAAAAIPIAALAAAMWAEKNDFGLLTWLHMPAWLHVLVAMIILDLAIWFQHLVSHALPGLWRLHRVHHADRDFDVTTAVRFHPAEIALSMVWKALVVLAIGAPPGAVVAFEIILNACAMFNHANCRLPIALDRWLRVAIVTPDMHRVHHSTDPSEHNANFGFNLSVWDRLFGTYVPAPREGHINMVIGLAPYQSEAPSKLGWSLALPFVKRSD